MIYTLPVLVALSWVPIEHTAVQPTVLPAAVQNADRAAQAVETITCPITGKDIPSCCCPAKE